MDEQLRIEFNEWARAGRGANMERGHRPTGEQAIERMDIRDDSSVLDLGCGNGWAARLIASRAGKGRVVGIDISEEMVELARQESGAFNNIEFRVASAQALPFDDDEFTHVFSMESIYYYADMASALREVRRVISPGGVFLAVVDLYEENEPTHQWVEQLNVPVQLLSIPRYRELLNESGFDNIQDSRLYDSTPVPDDYTGSSFKTREDLVRYRQTGSLMLSGQVTS